MSIPPSFIVLFSVIPHLPFFHKKDIQQQIANLVKDMIPAEGYNGTIILFINKTFFGDASLGLISLGLVLALYFASNAMMGIMRSFNKNYPGFTDRKRLHKRWVAIKLTSLLFSLILGCLIILLTENSVLKWLNLKNAGWRSFIAYARWIFIISLIFFSVAFIFRYAPAVHKRWKFFSPGVILATLLSFGATWSFGFLVNNVIRYNALFGSINAIIVLMVIIFINSLVLLIGFELNVSINSIKHLAELREVEEKLVREKK